MKEQTGVSMAKGAVNKKVIAIYCLMAFCCLTVPSLAQQRYLSRKITISVISVSLEEALATIGKAGNFTFSYNADLIQPDRKVTVQASNRNVDAVLVDLLGEKVRKKEVGDHVILVMNPPRDEKQKGRTETSVTGIVTDAASGKVLRDVTIYEVGGKRSALTNPGGEFSITFPNGENLRGLSISKSGYRDTVLFIRPIRDRRLAIAIRTRTPAIERVPLKQGAVSVSTGSAGGLTLDSLALVNAVVPRRLRINSINLHIFDTWPVQFSLVPYISTNWKVSGSVNNAFSLNLLAGYSGGVRGVEIGGLLNIDRNQVHGFQVGGLGNIVGRNSSGMQIGGLFNIDFGQFNGCEMAGLFNWVGDTLRGLQLAGLCNYIPVRWRGAQVAGLLNISLDHVTGFQLAGLMNIAKEENRGVQVAGFLNYAKTLKGVQVGLFNVAGKVESGVPIGFFSYVHKGGYIRAEVSGDEVFYLNIAFKTGTKRLYNIFKVGTNDSLLLNFAYGIGTLFPMGKRFGFNIDFTGSMFFNPLNNMAWYGSQLKLATTFEYRPAKHFAVFLGPAFNFCFYSDAGDKAYPKGLPFYNFYDQYHSGTREQMWVGGVVGFRI
jgi:hypothetical protein